MNKPIHVPATSLLSHLSASSLGTYLRCPALFRFRYVLKRPPAHRSVALVFGSAWGTTLAHWLVEASTSLLTAGDLYPVFEAELDRELEESDVPVAFGKQETRDTVVATSRNMLDVFLRKVQLPGEVLGIETAFSVYLEHPDDPEERLDIPLLGAFDAVVVVGGEPVIWEFKSSARRYSVGQFEFMLQPSVYTVGARAFGYDDLPVDVVVTTKTSKPDVQVERLRKDHRDERELFDLAQNVVRAVEAGVFPRNRSAMTCPSCEYRSECDR